MLLVYCLHIRDSFTRFSYFSKLLSICFEYSRILSTTMFSAYLLLIIISVYLLICTLAKQDRIKV